MSRGMTILLTVVIARFVNPDPAYALDPGMPTYSGNGAESEPVPYSLTNMMQAIYNSESNGTDFWMDRMLARPGVEPPQGANDLLTKGRCLYMKDHDAADIGFGGHTAYMDERGGDDDSYTINFSNGSYTEDTSKRVNCPSHWVSEYNRGSINVRVRKFITFNNVMVTCLTISNSGASSATFTMFVGSEHATSGSGEELTGTYPCYRSLIDIGTRLSADGMTVSGSALARSITLAAGQAVTTKVQMVYTTTALPESQTEYTTYRGYSPDTAFTTHVRDYNRWWVDNIPYVDLPDPYMKKMAYYRFWINRYNFLDANLPGTPWGFPTSVEGVDGYNNSIPNSVCYHIQDDKYFRDPLYAYGTWMDSGENAGNGMYRCDPAGERWGESRYENFTSYAGLDAYRIHGGSNSVATKFAIYSEKDSNGQLAHWGGTSNLITLTHRGETGMDNDAISFSYYERNQARVESAYVYAGFVAAQKLYAVAGNGGKSQEMASSASKVQSAVLGKLWDNNAKVFKNMDSQTGTLIPWKELQVFTPFSFDLVPTDVVYRTAFKLWTPASNAFSIFPYYTTDQNDHAACAAAGRPAGNNFASLCSSIDMILFINSLRKYPSPYLTTNMFNQLLSWTAWAQYIDGNSTYPDANEFWADWNPVTQHIDYRSWIHHNVLGSFNFALIEGIGGLVPREDQQIELWPIDIGYDYFTFNNIRYHGSDMTLIWDRTGSRYGGPAGYSLYLDGTRMFTVNKLVHLIWNASDGSIAYPEGGAATTVYSNSNTTFLAANQVPLSGRVVTYLQKAGVPIAAPMPPSFTAYNDCAWTVSSPYSPDDNDVTGLFTTNSPLIPTSQFLLNTTGTFIPVQVTFQTNSAVGLSLLNGNFSIPSGTDVDTWFDGKIGANNAVNWSSGSVTMTLSGLDTGKTYNIVLWSSRGFSSGAYSNRFTDVTISSAESYTNLSSPGTEAPSVLTSNDRIRLRSSIAPGYVARYDGVRTGSDGTVLFTLTAGSDLLWPSAASSPNGYLNAFMISTSTNQASPTTPPVQTNTPSAAWTAFNDIGWISGEPSTNITFLSPAGTAAGVLKDKVASTSLTVQVAFGGTAGFYANPANLTGGTPAEQIFGNQVGLDGYVTWGSGTVTITLSNLNADQQYSFAMFGSRGLANYTYRWTDVRITGADGFVNNSSAGSVISTANMPNDETRILAANTEGRVWRYDAIQPGTDGTVSFTATAGGSTSTGGYLNAFMLQPWSGSAVVVPDSWILANFGSTNVDLSSDADGDGLSNRQEYIAATGPNDGSSRPRITAGRTQGGLVSFDLQAATQRIYHIEYRTNLWTGSWQPYATVSGAGTTLVVTNAGSAPEQFYRFRVSLP